MKVGLIGLGRMGEGMSRRMMKQGIEVYGYRRNYAKAQEAAESGYITDAADSLESLVQVVKSKRVSMVRSPVRQSMLRLQASSNSSSPQN